MTLRPEDLAPLPDALLAQAREDAAATRARAEGEAGALMDHARERAAATLAAARAEGEAEAARLAAMDAARARRQARSVVLGARREAYEELRRRTREAARTLLADPMVAERLRTRALELAGPGAQVTEHPEGGYVAVARGRRADCSLPALVERALAEPRTGTELLWEP